MGPRRSNREGGPHASSRIRRTRAPPLRVIRLYETPSRSRSSRGFSEQALRRLGHHDRKYAMARPKPAPRRRRLPSEAAAGSTSLATRSVSSSQVPSVAHELVECVYYWKSVAIFIEETARGQRSCDRRFPPEDAIAKAIWGFLNYSIHFFEELFLP